MKPGREEKSDVFTAVVTDIIDGDTRYRSGVELGRRGVKRIRPAGCDVPEEGHEAFEESPKRLRELIQGETVTIDPIVVAKFERLVSDVVFQGKPLRKSFGT